MAVSKLSILCLAVYGLNPFIFESVFGLISLLLICFERKLRRKISSLFFSATMLGLLVHHSLCALQESVPVFVTYAATIIPVVFGYGWIMMLLRRSKKQKLHIARKCSSDYEPWTPIDPWIIQA